MPFFKRGRKSFPKRAYKKSGYRKKTLSTKVKVLAKRIAKQRPEVKYSSTYYLNEVADPQPTTNITPYRGISQGTADFQRRVGDKIRVTSFMLRSTWHPPINTSGTCGRLLIFVYKRNPDAITTAPSTVINLYLESSTLGTGVATQTFKDYDNKGSFVTLYDQRRAFNPANNAATLVSQHTWDVNVKIPESCRTVTYNNGGVYPTANELYVYFLSDVSSVLYVDYNYMLRYTDV